MRTKPSSPLKFRAFAFLAIASLLATALLSAPAQTRQASASPSNQDRADGPLTPQVSRALNVGKTEALASVPPTNPATALKREPITGTNRPIPRPGASRRGPDSSTVFVEPLEQPNPLFASSWPAVRSFDGLDALDDWNTIGAIYAPPDTDGAVGPNHYLQMVNSIFAVYDKDTGGLLGGPWANNLFWDLANTGTACETTNDGDPIVLYDQLADRWLISQFALPNFPAGPFYECIAISASGNPLGSWYAYTFQISADKMDDYPKFGIWPDGYYMSVNQFNQNTLDWGGSGVVAFERDQMLLGNPAQMVYFDNASDDIGGLLPSNLEGMTTPAPNTPNFFVQAADDDWGLTASDELRVWEFHVDWTTPANSTFTTVADLLTNPFDSEVCAGYSRDCIAQPGTSQKLDAISDRLMFPLNYRNFGTHESMVVNHTVDVGVDHAGVRWYELRNTGSGWSIYQQGDYAPDADQRWMGSMSIDSQGNIALGYSVSSATTYPSVRYTGRLAGDPLGSMTLGENSLVEGSGSQLGINRWGDYSAMLVDPVDDCTFWYTQEYVKTTGSFNWDTRIGAFKASTCGATWGSLSGTVDDGTDPVQDAVVTITGGATATTDASGYYTFPALPAGSYDMTVTKYGYSDGTANGVVVTDGNPTTQNFSLSLLPKSTVSGTVTDANTAKPLSAQIYIPEYIGSPISTDSSGHYSVQLTDGVAHHFTVVAAGYLDGTATVTPSGAPITQDFALEADLAACTAPGYTFLGFSQDFNSATFPPTGWNVTDVAGNGVVWDLSSAWGDGNYTGGSGDAADANSDAAPYIEFDTILTSPTIIVADLPSQTLTYLANYQNYANYDYLDLDISVDGGAWVNLLSWNEDHGAQDSTPGESVTVDLSPLLGSATSFQLRWHYYDPNAFDWDWYAQIDDVNIGQCYLSKTATFRSQAANDGWVMEATETSNTGGMMDSTANTFRLGDTMRNQQYRSILSFYTASLPNDAVIISAKLSIRKQGLVGTNPFDTHGGLKVDIRKGRFGTLAALQLIDFQALASKNLVGTFNKTPANNWYTANLGSQAFPYLNLTGLTQLRLRFAKDDNNDFGTDYMAFFSGNASLWAKPKLIVKYYYVP
ncbi:MAG: carboxypeptidase regulatory-like domain-containing protein [Chloroflexota bacterium]